MDIMKIYFIFMKFPSKSEAFACSDIRKVMQHNHDIKIFNMRKSDKDSNRLIKERKLQALKISKSTIASNLHGILIAILFPNISIPFLSWCLKNSNYKFIHLVKTLILFPRTLIFCLRLEKQAQILSIFSGDIILLCWGIY